MSFYEKLKFNADGLVPAIIQDAASGEVLMMAWMNRASLEKTVETGKTWFWSRSRQKYWMKGESSGHTQTVKDIRFDCDGDTLLIRYQMRNSSPKVTIDDVTLSDTIPAGLTLVDADGRVLETSGRYRATLGYPPEFWQDRTIIDLLVPESTPIFAITGGTVVSIQTFAGNWWTDGCNTNHAPVGCSTCGTGLTIQTPDGLRHTYCHARRLYVTRGDQIAPGQHIADSGNTGRSGAPHLHLEMRLNGQRVCPQALMNAVYANDRLTDEQVVEIRARYATLLDALYRDEIDS